MLEGVAFGLRDGLDQMIAAGMPAPDQIRASGGGTASPLWRQILADVLDAEIATVSTTEGAAFGAALLAAVGAGWFPTVEAAADGLVTAHAGRLARPGCEPAMPRRTRVYRELYPALAPTFHRAEAGGGPTAAPRGLSRRSSSRASSFSVDLVGLLAEDDHAEDVVGRDRRLVDRVDDLAVVHDADPVGQVEHVVDVVADEEDADALVLELADRGCGPGRSRPARAPPWARP